VSQPYAAEKLIAQARQLAADYRRTMGKPLPGGQLGFGKGQSE